MNNRKYIFLLSLLLTCLCCNFSYSQNKYDVSLSRLESQLRKCQSKLDSGDIQGAGNLIVLAEKTLRISQPAHPRMLFRYYAQKGRYYAFTGNIEEARNYFALALKKENDMVLLGFHNEIAEVYGNIAELHARTFYFNEAVNNYRIALFRLHESGQKNFLLEKNYKILLANAYLNDCHLKEAKRIIDSCQSVINHSSISLKKEYVDIYLGMAEYFLNTEQYPVAERYLNYASLILKESYPKSHFKYGILYYLKGLYNSGILEYGSSAQFIFEASEIISHYPSLLVYRHLNNSFKCAFYVGRDSEKSFKSCRQALVDNELSRKYPAALYYNIGRTYLTLKDTVQTIKYFKLAIQAASSHPNLRQYQELTKSYRNLANLYQIKSPEQSMKYLKKALVSAQKISYRNYDVSRIYTSMGLAYFTKGDYRKSLFYLQQSIIAGCYTFNDTSVLANPIYSDVQPYLYIETFLMKANNLYNLYRYVTPKQEYLETALGCNELAVELLQKRIVDFDEESASLSFIDNVKRTMNNAIFWAVRLYMLTGEKIYAEKAFDYAEKSKMQVLLINIMKKEKLQHAGVPDSIIQKIENINNRILTMENQLSLQNKQMTEVNGETRVMLIRLYTEQDELNLAIREQYPEVNKSLYDIRVAGIKKIQKMLEPDQALIEYQFQNVQSMIFVISKDTFTVQFLINGKEIQNHIDRLREIISTSPATGDYQKNFLCFTESSSFLYHELIMPVYDQIKGKRLIIIPENQLTLIPFEVLIADSPSGKYKNNYRDLPYLIKEFPIVYAYSANFLLDQGSKIKYGSGTAVFLPDYKSYGMSNGSYLFPELEGAVTEAENIRKISGSRVFSGDKANEAFFKSKSPKYRVLHIASHTILNEDKPSLSCLVMTHSADSMNEGYLHSYELQQLKLNAQLVVLSGCNTGYGKLRISEGLVSLARSLFYTNVRTVALTLWPVADNSGSTLISSFYKGLKDKETLDLAMRDAKLEFIHSADPVKTHPYYWANYMIVGKTENVPIQSPYSPVLKILIILILVALPSGYFIRKKVRS
jgi:CHAT domain-containing protein